MERVGYSQVLGGWPAWNPQDGTVLHSPAMGRLRYSAADGWEFAYPAAPDLRAPTTWPPTRDELLELAAQANEELDHINAALDRLWADDLARGNPDGFIPQTELGKKLWALRQAAVAAGTKLQPANELLRD